MRGYGVSGLHNHSWALTCGFVVEMDFQLEYFKAGWRRGRSRAGAQAMRNGTLQRFFRDSHAGTQQRGSAHVVTQQCGRMLSGTLPPGSHWGFFDLVVPDVTNN